MSTPISSARLNVLQACRESSTLVRLVHVSTSEVYGTAQQVPIPESHPLVGQSPYSATKIAADKLAESFHRSFDLPVVIARPFNTYGPRQTARAVIPTIAAQLLAGCEVLKLGSLDPTRDFNYVTDTAAGMLALALCREAEGQVVNIGSGTEWSIKQTVELALRDRSSARARSKPTQAASDRARARFNGLSRTTGASRSSPGGAARCRFGPASNAPSNGLSRTSPLQPRSPTRDENPVRHAGDESCACSTDCGQRSHRKLKLNAPATSLPTACSIGSGSREPPISKLPATCIVKEWEVTARRHAKPDRELLARYERQLGGEARPVRCHRRRSAAVHGAGLHQYAGLPPSLYR